MGKTGKSIITLLERARIQGLVATANGAASLPRDDKGKTSGKAYRQNLFTLGSTTSKPELRVVRLTRSLGVVTGEVTITGATGDSQNPLKLKGSLTTDNAESTGEAIGAMLGGNGSTKKKCGAALLGFMEAEHPIIIFTRSNGDVTFTTEEVN